MFRLSVLGTTCNLLLSRLLGSLVRDDSLESLMLTGLTIPTESGMKLFPGFESYWRAV